MRVALISNVASGSAGEADVAALLAAAGADVACFEIADGERAGEAGADRVVVAGGDGSLAVGALAARAAGVPLAVVPAGTANDFAARMGLPEDLEEAVRLAADGTRTRKVDIAEVGDRAFLNVASLGLAPAAAEAAEGLKERLGPLAYALGAVRAGATEEPFDVRVSCDGSELFDGAAWQVTVGSTGAFGGGSQIEADADDGLLDVVVIEGGSRGCARPARLRPQAGRDRGAGRRPRLARRRDHGRRSDRATTSTSTASSWRRARSATTTARRAPALRRRDRELELVIA